MRTSIMKLGFLAAVMVATMVPGMASAQDNTAPPPANMPPPAAPPPDPSAPSGNVAKTGAVRIDAPPLTGFSLFGILGYGYGDGVGVGARYMIPLPIPSLLTHTWLRDSWAVEFGGDLMYYSLGVADYHETVLIPVAGVMWNVWLNDQFAVYPKAEIGFGIDVGSTYNGVVEHNGIYPSGAAGLLYQVTKQITLRAEVGSTGLRGGAGFFF